jgi:hypothetical protein
MGKYEEVLRPFLALMEKELHANAGKGDRPGWLQMDSKTAILEVFYHMGKLHQAVHRGEAEAIKEYAADVANMCMMLVDVFGLLPEDEQPAPAAIGQRAPVAWMYRRKGGECLGQLVKMESDSLKAMREGVMGPLQRILWPREDCIDWKPLYAEQPAPVAVVLPTRQRISAQNSHDWDEGRNDGWKAYENELKRLNPSL